MQSVAELMDTNPIFCTRETRIAEIKHLLKKYDWSEILVVDEAHHPVGVVGFDDVNSLAIEHSDIPSDVSADECMRKVPAVVLDSSSLEECLNVMRLNHVDSLPVVDGNGHMEGVIKKEAITRMIM